MFMGAQVKEPSKLCNVLDKEHKITILFGVNSSDLRIKQQMYYILDIRFRLDLPYDLWSAVQI